MGVLYIVATPIGNLEDISIRAIKTLFSVHVITCEDTRRTGLLLQELQKRYSVMMTNHITPKLIRYSDQIEQSKTPEIIALLEQGNDIALVSDAGTPLINDPGFILVREALKRNLHVVSIPGPTAAVSALCVSGLPANNFFFLGYPPEKEKHRKDLFRSLLTMQPLNHPTIIFYCAPHKLVQTLLDMNEVFGNIEIVLARELTKIHEEVWRGTIHEALEKFKNPLGEFVILFTLK